MVVGVRVRACVFADFLSSRGPSVRLCRLILRVDEQIMSVVPSHLIMES